MSLRRAFNKAVLGLSLTFGAMVLPPQPVAAAVSPSVTAATAAAASSAAAAARRRRESKAKDKVLELIANPSAKTSAIREAMKNSDYVFDNVFGPRELVFLAEARASLSLQGRQLTEQQAEAVAFKANDLSIIHAAENTREVLKNPASTIDQIKAAMNGYGLKLYKQSDVLYPEHLDFLDSARKVILQGRTTRATDGEVVRMVNTMSDLSDKRFLKHLGIFGGVVVAAIGATALYRRNRRNDNRY